MADAKDDIVLSIRGMCKSFGRNRVLDHINLDVKRGTVMGLMGENGAGKSTMMKCLFGTYQKDEGKIYLNGKEISFSGPKDALENGIAMVHQELNQCLERSVTDNLFLGRYPTNSAGVVDEGSMKKKASFPDTFQDFFPVNSRQGDPLFFIILYLSFRLFLTTDHTGKHLSSLIFYHFRLYYLSRNTGMKRRRHKSFRFSDPLALPDMIPGPDSQAAKPPKGLFCQDRHSFRPVFPYRNIHGQRLIITIGGMDPSRKSLCRI